MVCFSREVHRVAFPRCRALFNAGSSIDARIAMIAITMRSSIKVKYLPDFASAAVGLLFGVICMVCLLLKWFSGNCFWNMKRSFL